MVVSENLGFSGRDSALTAFYVVLFFVAGYLIYKSNLKRSQPPCLSGWLPYLGCAIDFGKDPLNFIKQAKDKLGPVFTLYVAGKRLTFVTDQDDFQDAYFKSSSLSFSAAVTDAVEHNASVPKEAFLKTHTRMHDCVKGKLAIHQLSSLSDHLCNGFTKRIAVLKEKVKENNKVELSGACRDVMYAAVMDSLFGEGVLPTKDKVKLEKLTETFVLYDDQFEYGSQLPEIFLKDWSKCKWWLLNLFHKVVKEAEKQSQTMEKRETLLQALIKSVADRRYAPNFGMMMLWASLANAIPIAFWTISLILENETIHKKVKAEVSSCLGDKTGEVTNEDLGEMPLLRQCMMEAIRLRSPGVIARKVVRPFELKGYKIPVGDMLMLSPYWAHRDTRYFPDPEQFKPERWNNGDIDKNVFLDGFVAFGGGRYQCPGRWFAIMEIHMVIALLFNTFDMKLLSKVPAPSSLHVVGVQQPSGQCYVEMDFRA